LKELFQTTNSDNYQPRLPNVNNACDWLDPPPHRLVHTLPGYVRAEPGRTGHDLECGAFYQGGEKEQVFSCPGMTGYAWA